MRAPCCASQQSLPPIDSFASNSIFRRCPRHVRFPSDSDRTADKLEVRVGPNSDLARCPPFGRYEVQSRHSADIAEGLKSDPAGHERASPDKAAAGGDQDTALVSLLVSPCP